MWTSEDQNPSMSPSAAYGQTNYAATLNNAAYYNPMGSGGTMAPSMASTPMSGAGGSYADQLNAMAPQQPWETRETSRGLSKSAQRSVPANMSAYTDAYSSRGRGLPASHGVAIQAEAGRLGVEPSDLAAVIGYETIGTFDPGITGGKRNKYQGLIQMGPSERKAYGWRDGMSFEEQLFGPVHNYLVDRGVRPGQGIGELYSIINAGSLKGNGQPRWGASDRPGWNVRRHTNEIASTYDPRYAYLDPGAATGDANPGVMMASAGQETMVGGDVPNPRLRPERTEMAYAPSPETMDQAPFDAVLAASRDRRPQPPTPPANPRRDQLQATAPAPAAAPEAQGGAYVVKRGDNLSRIAQRELGDPNRWREIAQANGIRNPNVIQPGQRLVIPGQAPVEVPQPRPRPERGANVPTPRMRPSREVDIPTPRPRPSPQQASPLAQEPGVPWLERQFVDGKARPGPVIPRTSLEKAQLAYRAPDRSLAAGGNLGTPETQMSLDASARPPPGTAVYGNEAAVNRAGKGDRMNTTPAGPGMDTSGLIREPTAGERALQGGARMPLPTGPQPMNPVLAEQIRRNPAIITEVAPPTYTAPNGARVWALR